ncbi:hypothetical protein [Marinobacter sp.]|uniref:hypothetical protein n=1 Tax=Marinobacter sp. TaxID=50741 RepID=UPI003BA934E1
MEAPNYQNYSLYELRDALSGLDRDKFPERGQVIEEEIENRKSAGFVLSGEHPSVVFREAGLNWKKVAMPFWWRFFWRTAVANFVVSSILSLALLLIFSLIGADTGVIKPIVYGSQVILVPVLGVYFVRQALVGRYKHFHIEVVRKTD